MIIVAFAVACDAVRPPESQQPSAGPIVIGLRTMAVNDCSGVGQSGVIRGEPTDPEVVWEEPLVGPGPRTHVIWPTGYRALFDPTLSVLDEHGRPILRDGDYVDGACVIGDRRSDPLLLMPPFLAFRLECGPMPVHDCVGRVAEAARNADSESHPIAVLRFSDNRGAYRVFYEDGTTGGGITVLQ